MTLLIAAAELVSIEYLLIILVSLIKNLDKRSVSNRFYIAFTVSAIVGLLFDALSYITEEQRIGGTMVILINIAAFSTINICITLFAFYLIAFIRNKQGISYRSVIPVLIITVVNILLIIIGAVNEQFFSIKEGIYAYGPWSRYVTLMPILSVIYILFVMIYYFKYLGKRDMAVLSSFVVFPIISAIILLFFPDLAFGYISTSLSCVVIYTFIRREEIIAAQNREKIEKELSTLDTLTGLLNRRGYNQAIEKAAEHTLLGIVFCDLNALKYTNDNFGHAAGDAYIQRFADILRKVFDDLGPICRISGDEFVVLLCDIPEDKYNELKNKLNSAIMENERIASAGYAYGDSYCTMELLKAAEEEMYVDKSRYYKETGLERRRQMSN